MIVKAVIADATVIPGCRRLPRMLIDHLPKQLEAWHDFYLVVGTGAAALTGLLFVIVSLGPHVVGGHGQASNARLDLVRRASRRLLRADPRLGSPDRHEPGDRPLCDRGDDAAAGCGRHSQRMGCRAVGGAAGAAGTSGEEASAPAVG